MIAAVLKLLGGAFGSVVLYVVAGLVIALGAGLGWAHVWTIPHLERQVAAEKKRADDEHTGRMADRAVAAEAAASQALAFKHQQEAWQQRADTAQETADAKTQQLDRAIATGGPVADRLRNRIATLEAAVRRPAAAASAAAGSQAASDPAGMLADLCRRADARSDVLALYADKLRISAEACVGAWPVNPPR